VSFVAEILKPVSQPAATQKSIAVTVDQGNIAEQQASFS
jgi:hypothetical protein